MLDFEASETCLDAYRRTGWLGIVPDSCASRTLLVPRDGEWTLWGWPYRFLNRLAAADARLLIVDGRDGYRLKGLDRPEQLGEVPRHYRGLLLVEDMFDVGRALQRP